MKLKAKLFISLILGALILFLIALFTAQADKPWWGLVVNPAAKYNTGTTLNSIQAEFGVNNRKLQEFYSKYKSLPKSFQELDKKTLAGEVENNPFSEKTGKVAAKSIQSSTGYDSKDYKITYKDGSFCNFSLQKSGYEMTCTRRDYWLNGKLKKYIYKNDTFK